MVGSTFLPLNFGDNPTAKPMVNPENGTFFLFVRELWARFGRLRLGYLWAILEPLALVGAFSGLKVLLGSEPIGGVPYPLFSRPGSWAICFSNTSSLLSLSAVEANLGLFNYRHIKPADTVLSRAMVEARIFL